ncbi:MAG: tetratricopeptide repeat protein [Anaerotignum sp.]
MRQICTIWGLFSTPWVCTQKAVEYYKKAAVLKRDCSGESLSYADTVNNLAIAYNNMGEGEKARRFHGEVLKIREAKLGKDHPDTIYSLFHLGNTEEDLQQYEKAGGIPPAGFGAGKDRSADFSKEDMADIFASLGSAYDGGGNYRRSISSYEKALDFMEKAGVVGKLLLYDLDIISGGGLRKSWLE